MRQSVDEPRRAPALRCDAVSFHRREEAPGLELCQVAGGARVWWTFCTEVQLLLTSTQVRVWYRRREYQLTPGQIFCASPGEVVKVLRVDRPGTLNMLGIAPELLSGTGAKHCSVAQHARSLPTVARVTPLGQELLHELCQALLGLAPIGSVCSALTLMLESVHGAPCARGSAGAVANTAPACGCGSAEPLSEGGAARVPFARKDLSRFQTNRRFKHRYGLAPHQYKVCVKIAQARQLLRAGQSPSWVAVAQGFTDQSHFTRHFKRLVGVTPRQYAGAGGHGHPQRTPDERR